MFKKVGNVSHYYDDEIDFKKCGNVVLCQGLNFIYRRVGVIKNFEFKGKVKSMRALKVKVKKLERLSA